MDVETTEVTGSVVTETNTPPLVPLAQAPAVIPVTKPVAPKQEDAPKQEAVALNGKQVVLPTATLGRLKAEAREKGKKAAQEEFLKTVRESGFSSIEELIKAAKTKAESEKTTPLANQAAPTPTLPTKAPEQKSGAGKATAMTPHEIEIQKLRKQLETATTEKEAAKKRAEQEHQRKRDTQRRLEAAQVDAEIRETAVRLGVKDVDYACTLLRRELKTKTEDELRTFDETKFFTELREKTPYIFGEVIKPATTGPGAGKEPVLPNKTPVQEKFDARKATPEQIQARLKQLGLKPPTI